MKIVLIQQQATKDQRSNLKRGVEAFQNGYFSALVNRVGKEDRLHFSGESFVTDPFGRVISRAPRGEDFILLAECDFQMIAESPARKYFVQDRRPDFYSKLNLWKG